MSKLNRPRYRTTKPLPDVNGEIPKGTIFDWDEDEKVYVCSYKEVSSFMYDLYKLPHWAVNSMEKYFKPIS